MGIQAEKASHLERAHPKKSFWFQTSPYNTRARQQNKDYQIHREYNPGLNTLPGCPSVKPIQVVSQYLIIQEHMRAALRYWIDS